ncbi:42857_t:CDS:2, partial [Gigaspora margarita]
HKVFRKPLENDCKREKLTKANKQFTTNNDPINRQKSSNSGGSNKGGNRRNPTNSNNFSNSDDLTKQ